MAELFIKLNGEEVLLLCSRIKNWDVDFNSGNMIAPRLLLKLFSVFNELVTDKGFSMQELPVSVSERELWLMRTYVQPSDRITEKNPLLGIILMRKLHALLLEANADIPFDELEAQLKEWAKQQPERKEEKNAAGESEPNENADYHSEKGSADQSDSEIGTGENLSRPEGKGSSED